MLAIRDITDYLEGIAPLSFQEDYDNSGLIIGDEDAMASGCIIGLDLTERLIDEAINANCNFIITHHPVIFGQLKRLTGKSVTERLVAMALKADIAVYAIHTNLDNILGGVNKMLCDKIGLTDLRILRKQSGMLKKLITFCPGPYAETVRAALFHAGAGHIGKYDQCSFNLDGIGTFRAGEGADPFTGRIGEIHYESEARIETVFPAYLQKAVIGALLAAHPYEEVAYDIYPLENDFDQAGAGMTGLLESPMGEEDFLRRIKEVLQAPCLRHSALTGNQVKKVAVCGGSGSFLIQDAIRQQADIFLSADIKYHQFQEADGKIVIVDAGHYETEQFTCDLIASYLKEKFSNFAVLISKESGNPVNYF